MFVLIQYAVTHTVYETKTLPRAHTLYCDVKFRQNFPATRLTPQEGVKLLVGDKITFRHDMHQQNIRVSSNLLLLYTYDRLHYCGVTPWEECVGADKYNCVALLRVGLLSNRLNPFVFSDFFSMRSLRCLYHTLTQFKLASSSYVLLSFSLSHINKSCNESVCT